MDIKGVFRNLYPLTVSYYSHSNSNYPRAYVPCASGTPMAVEQAEQEGI